MRHHLNTCVTCRDWGHIERHEDHWPPRPAEDVTDCTCVHSCADHPPTACSLSGQWHVHPNRYPGDVFGACPLHPEAPGDL